MRDLRHDTAMNGVGDQRQGWFVRRMGRRVLIGTLIGAAVGTAVGVLAGVLIFQPGSQAVWGTTVAGLVFGVLFSLVLSGMSALGSPPPGREPEDPARTDRDVPGFTRDERA